MQSPGLAPLSRQLHVKPNAKTVPTIVTTVAIGVGPNVLVSDIAPGVLKIVYDIENRIQWMLCRHTLGLLHIQGPHTCPP